MGKPHGIGTWGLHHGTLPWGRDWDFTGKIHWTCHGEYTHGNTLFIFTMTGPLARKINGIFMGFPWESNVGHPISETD